MKQEKRFRKAYIAQSSQYDFHEITKLCQKVVFVTTGYESDEVLLESIREALRDFSPQQDLLVPVGPVGVNLLIGKVLGERTDPKIDKIAVALYREKQYEILQI